MRNLDLKSCSTDRFLRAGERGGLVEYTLNQASMVKRRWTPFYCSSSLYLQTYVLKQKKTKGKSERDGRECDRTVKDVSVGVGGVDEREVGVSGVDEREVTTGVDRGWKWIGRV